MSGLRELVLGWYALLNGLSSGLSGPLAAVARQWDIPAVSALLFGLIGSLAPCQVTANASAMAYLSKQVGERHKVWPDALAYVLGKVMVYTVLGLIAIGLGLTMPTAVMVWVRKLFGPLMILFALYVLRLIKLRFTLGEGISSRLQARLPGQGGAGAFLLGAAYSLIFCPTMALLFFGVLVPLGLRSTGGIALPAFFGAGTAVPLLIFAWILALGLEAAPDLIRRAHRWDRYLRLGVGAVFLFAGLHDTVIYWLV